MKLTLKEVNEKYIGLADLGKLVLPIKLSYAVAKNIDTLQPHVERIEKERKKLCEQYAKKDEDGNPKMIKSIVGGQERSNYDMDPGEQQAMNKEYEDFLETEEVDVEIRKVKLSLIEECEKDRYNIPNVANQTALMFMLEE